MKRLDKQKLKYIAIGATVYVLTVITAFGFGSFNPNPWKLSEIKNKIENVYVSRAIDLGLHEPDFVFNDDASFMVAVQKCVDFLNFTTKQQDRIPSAILVAMAGIESGWGKSRFAEEGNALFGVRTWNKDVPQIKPLDLPNAKFGVKTYPTKCQSVKDVIDILNRHPAYKEFREDRKEQDGEWNYEVLVQGLAPWSTNEKYSAIILDTINSRQLP